MKRNLLMGVGNDIRGDDAVGELVAREFEHENWETVDCGSVPENHIIMVEKDDYETVILVDAANMELEPGEIRIVSRELLNVFTMSTHALPLSLVIDYLEERVDEVYLIGIQPKDMRLKEGITPELREAKEKILELLNNGEWRNIQRLEKNKN